MLKVVYKKKDISQHFPLPQFQSFPFNAEAGKKTHREVDLHRGLSMLPNYWHQRI